MSKLEVGALINGYISVTLCHYLWKLAITFERQSRFSCRLCPIFRTTFNHCWCPATKKAGQM